MQVKAIFDTTGASLDEILAVQRLLDVHDLLVKFVRKKTLSEAEFFKADGLVHVTEEDREKGTINFDHFNPTNDQSLIKALILDNHYYYKNIHAEKTDHENTINLITTVTALNAYFIQYIWQTKEECIL